MEKLKINYHITEECNFHCKFCFAKYTNKTLGFEEQKAVVKKLPSQISLTKSILQEGSHCWTRTLLP